MSEARPRVLVVDDDESFARLLTDVLAEKQYSVVVAHDAATAETAVRSGEFDAAVVDLILPGASGLDVADRIRSKSPDTQVVILTGHGTLESAISGIQHGIFDYLEKGSLDLTRLERTLRLAVDRARLARENRGLIARLEESNRSLRALHEEGARLGDEPHLDRLLPSLVEAAKTLCGAAAARVMLLRRTGEVLVIETSVGDAAAALTGARLQPGEGLATRAALENETLRLADAATDPGYSHRCDEMASGLPGWLAAPLCRGGVLGALVVAGRAGGFEPEHAHLLTSLGRLAALCIENSLDHERSVNFFAHVSDLLIQVLERLDVYYPGHSRRVAALADMVTRRLGLDESERRAIHFGALLHDIGKIRIDPKVLAAAGDLAEARAELLMHPTYGLEMLRSITALEDVLPVVHGHHERWDGKGYPRGLAGEEIPLGARVVCVADAFDAMTRDTPHTRVKSAEQALEELERFAGGQFDPRIVRVFVAAYREQGHPMDGAQA